MGSDQKTFGWGVCDHSRTIPVKTYGDKTVAFQCAGCTKIMCHYGVCDGCNKGPQKLLVFTGRSRKRYCDEQCKSRSVARERKLKKAVL